MNLGDVLYSNAFAGICYISFAGACVLGLIALTNKTGKIRKEVLS
jgi:hypothetical protein